MLDKYLYYKKVFHSYNKNNFSTLLFVFVMCCVGMKWALNLWRDEMEYIIWIYFIRMETKKV